MRITCIAVALVLVLGVAAFAGIGPGTVETSFGGTFHISPEPWELSADMYLVYFLSETLGFGPFWEIQKTGDLEDYYYFDGTTYVTGTFKSAWHYKLGVLGKMYLPVTLADGKLMPYVMLGAGLASLPKAEWDNPLEEQTESKFGFVGELSFDYWMTESWTIWAGVRGSKISGDADTYFDMYGRDLTDFQTQVLVGISHFLMK